MSPKTVRPMKQRKLTLFILCSFMAMLLTSCRQSADDSSRPDDTDTVYTEPKAMSIHRNNPERALVMIDSAVIVGNITPMRGEYLKAITQYGGLDNFPLARQTCLQLLDDIDQKANSKTLSRLFRSSSTSGLSPRGHLERQAEFHASTQDEA